MPTGKGCHLWTDETRPTCRQRTLGLGCMQRLWRCSDKQPRWRPSDVKKLTNTGLRMNPWPGMSHRPHDSRLYRQRPKRPSSKRVTKRRPSPRLRTCLQVALAPPKPLPDALLTDVPVHHRPGVRHAVYTAQRGHQLAEADDHVFARMQATVRRALLGVGQRWVQQGALDSPEDVFWLPLDTVRSLDSQNDLPRKPDLAAVVRQNKNADRHWRQTPPSHFSSDNKTTPPQNQFIDEFTGTGTGGRFVGRVVKWSPELHSGTDTDVVNETQIVVARTLLPTVLPLLNPGAFITDTGGALDHVCAQARERALPAVVGVSTAFDTLKNGDLVRVDGKSGRVSVLSRA